MRNISKSRVCIHRNGGSHVVIVNLYVSRVSCSTAPPPGGTFTLPGPLLHRTFDDLCASTLAASLHATERLPAAHARSRAGSRRHSGRESRLSWGALRSHLRDDPRTRNSRLPRNERLGLWRHCESGNPGRCAHDSIDRCGKRGLVSRRRSRGRRARECRRRQWFVENLDQPRRSGAVRDDAKGGLLG